MTRKLLFNIKEDPIASFIQQDQINLKQQRNGTLIKVKKLPGRKRRGRGRKKSKLGIKNKIPKTHRVYFKVTNICSICNKSCKSPK